MSCKIDKQIQETETLTKSEKVLISAIRKVELSPAKSLNLIILKYEEVINDLQKDVKTLKQFLSLCEKSEDG